MTTTARRFSGALLAFLIATLILVGCGGGSDEAGGCPSFTMDFSDGPDTAFFRSVRPDVEKGLESCPHAAVESYPADGDQDAAQTSLNIASNFLTSIGDAVESKSTNIVADAPSPDLAGKVQVILSETQAAG